MKTIMNIVGGTFKVLAAIAIVGIIIVFGLSVRYNVESSRNDLRNYGLSVSKDTGITVTYEAPVADILTNSAYDTLEVCGDVLDYGFEYLGELSTR